MWQLLLDVTVAIWAGLCLVWLVVLYFADADLMLLFKDKFGNGPEILEGQVVWITGASSGIGEYTAYCLAKAGCRLVLSARREDELERVKAACLLQGRHKLSDGDVLTLVLDCLAFDSHQSAVQKVLEHFGKIDILLSNAGTSQRAPWMEIELDVDRALFELNVLGQVSLTQAVLPNMIERKKGHVAVVSSVAGKLGIPHSRSYNGTKCAVQGYFECLRTEMSQFNIDVTVLCPGPIFSNIFLHAATGKHSEKLGRAMAKTEKRMTTDKCAHYVSVALANKLYEAWITQQPWLYLLYINQFLPDLGRWILMRFGIKYLMKIREGQ